MATSAPVPPGLHHETKYVVLSYLGLLSQESRGPSPQGVQPHEASQFLDPEVLLKVKSEIEEELKTLDKEISEAFTSTGFDRHTSPVFTPADPESSIEDCLAHLGEQVWQELKEPLQKALQSLLSQPVTYPTFRELTLEAVGHTSGWNKIVVPLVLLRQMFLELTRRGEAPLRRLLQLGVTYLEDCAAEHLVQQGGWGAIFSLEPEDYPGLIAEDSNDIYILPSDNSGQVSPPESPTVTTSWQCESLPASLSASQSWHTESLPVSLGPESWQQIAMDPEEVKSLDSNGAGERSENNSSNSDIVHVEKEEIPEGAEAGPLPAPAPLHPHTTAPSLEAGEPHTQTAASEKASPVPSLLVELCKEEAEAATEEPAGMEGERALTLLSEKQGPGGEAKATLLFGGAGAPAALLLGGAAAVAVLAVAFGVALALKKK